jgi:ribonuclease D
MDQYTNHSNNLAMVARQYLGSALRKWSQASEWLACPA